MSGAEGLLTGIGVGVGYGAIADYAKLGVLWAKWKAMNLIAPTFIKDVFASTLQSILSSEHDPVSGMSSKGTVDVMWQFINNTIEMSLLIDEGIATQMFIQMIQQSIAYAIHASHAGAIGTIGNVYSGSSSLSVAFGDNVGHDLDFVDDKTLGFIASSLGSNLPTIGYQLTKGANQRLEEYTTRLRRDTELIIDEWNDLTLAYYRQYHTMCRDRFGNAITMKEDAVKRAYSILETMGNAYLTRIAEQFDSLEGARNWFDAGLISETELEQVTLRLQLENEASDKNYDEYKESVLGAVDDAMGEWDDYIEQSLGDLTLNEEAYNGMLQKMLYPIFNDVAMLTEAIVSRVNQVLTNICAYRNVTPPLQIVSDELPPLIEASGYIPLTEASIELEKDGLPHVPVDYILMRYSRWVKGADG